MERDQIITVCRVIGQMDLTANRVLILSAAQYDQLTMSELAREINKSLSATGSLVKTAIKDGLVRRIHAKHDLRKVTIRLTPKGSRTLQKFFARFEPVSA